MPNISCSSDLDHTRDLLEQSIAAVSLLKQAQNLVLELYPYLDMDDMPLLDDPICIAVRQREELIESIETYTGNVWGSSSPAMLQAAE